MRKRYYNYCLIMIGIITQFLETLASSIPSINNTYSSSTNKSEGEVNEKIPPLVQLVMELKAECSCLNQRLFLVENKSKNHENEIEILRNNLSSILATLRVEQELDEKIVIEPPIEIDTSSILIRRGRPAQLIPLQLNNGPTRNDPIDAEFGKNPPKNCEDLNKMGHTNNGIFLVNKATENGNSAKNNQLKLAAVFCNFQSSLPTVSNSIVGKHLGFLDVRSLPYGVYFYVQQSIMQDTSVSKVIDFNLQHLNIGNAMNMSTGVFTAPVSGIYQFSFSMSKYGFSSNELHVYLRHNSRKIGMSTSNAGFFSGLSSFQSVIVLKKGDRVDLYKDKGRILDDIPKCNHFSGMLLDETLTYN